VAEAVLRELYIDYDIKPKDVAPYIPGRCAVITVKDKEIGDFGEIHPKTISAFELGNPVTGINLDITKIMELD
jgi:phenylalanyl-tRNA synthetase beta chain